MTLRDALTAVVLCAGTLSYGVSAQTDLDGLAAFDSDGDGKLTAHDALWSSFGIVRDLNKNGVQDEGEFISLDQMGISSIGLQRQGKPEVNNGNVVFGTTEVGFTDGHTAQAGDVMFGGEITAFPDAAKAARAFEAIGCFPDHFECRIAREQGFDAAAKQRVVVHEQYPDRRHAASC